MTVPYRFRGAALLLLLAAVLPWTAWRFALRDTLGAWRDCRRLAAELAQAPAVAESEPGTLLPEPDVVLSGRLLEALRRTASQHAVQVCGYEPLETLRQDDLAVHTARLTLGGGCKSLLRVVDALERTLPRCRLRTLVWKTRTDRRTRRAELTLTLYIEQIVLIPSKP